MAANLSSFLTLPAPPLHASIPWCRAKVVATALTGDPDLYVTVGGSDLPGPHNFYWMGGATGEIAENKENRVGLYSLTSYFTFCVRSSKIVFQGN